MKQGDRVLIKNTYEFGTVIYVEPNNVIGVQYDEHSDYAGIWWYNSEEDVF